MSLKHNTDVRWYWSRLESCLCFQCSIKGTRRSVYVLNPFVNGICSIKKQSVFYLKYRHMEIVITYMNYHHRYWPPSTSDRRRPSQYCHRCLIWSVADWNVNEAFWSTAALSVKLAFRLISLFVHKMKNQASSPLTSELRDTNSLVCCQQVPQLLLRPGIDLALKGKTEGLWWERRICTRIPKWRWVSEREGEKKNWHHQQEESDSKEISAWKRSRTEKNCQERKWGAWGRRNEYIHLELRRNKGWIFDVSQSPRSQWGV